MPIAKTLLATAGLVVSGAHAAESVSDLWAAKSPTDKRDVSFQKSDGRLGLLASVTSIFPSIAVLRGRFASARVYSVLSFCSAAPQLVFGGIAYSIKEPGFDRQDLMLAGLQIASVLSGLSYASFSLPALVAMAKGGDDRALTKLFREWYLNRNREEVSNELSRLAVADPYRFVANDPTRLFSHAIDEESAREVLTNLLAVQEGSSLPNAALLVRQAIHDRPSLFRCEDDVKSLLLHLRSLQGGPAALDHLMVERPYLGREVIRRADEAFQGEDLARFADSLRGIWYRLSSERRGDFLADWSRAMRTGQANNWRPVRDLFRLLDEGRYHELVEECAKGNNTFFKLDQAATPFLEDIMNYHRYAGGDIDKIGELADIILRRSDMDITAFDFLWSRTFHYERGPDLRKKVLAHLSRIGSKPRWRDNQNYPELLITVHGEERVFGSAGLCNGWFDDHLRQATYLSEVSAVYDKNNPFGDLILRQIAHLNGLRFDRSRLEGARLFDQ